MTHFSEQSLTFQYSEDSIQIPNGDNASYTFRMNPVYYETSGQTITANSEIDTFNQEVGFDVTTVIPSSQPDTINECKAQVSQNKKLNNLQEDGKSNEIKLNSYPNPFSENSVINFWIPKSSNVSISLLNPSGQKVRQLTSGVKNSGHHAIRLKGKNLSNGVYLVKVRTEEEVIIRKIIKQ